jgi:ABC-type polysaccharide/polyol phosphate transport system ATPase subunit
MVTRLGFAIATAINPEILLLDEGLGAGDERFANRAQQRVEALIKRSSIMVLASHSTELIQQMCNRAILMHHGRILADGSPAEILEHYHALASAGMNESAVTPQATSPGNIEAEQALEPAATAAG